MFCTDCGKSNDDLARFCFSCGVPLKLPDGSVGEQKSADSIKHVPDTTPLSARVDGIKAPVSPRSSDEDERLWRAIIGIKSVDYYMPRFSSAPGTAKKVGRWNWSASLITLIWLLHRRLWKKAALYLLIPVALSFGIGILQGVMQTASPDSPIIEGLFAFIWLGYVVLLFVLPGMWGTGWLEAKYRAKIEATRLQLSTTEAREAYLLASGGTGLAGILYGVIIFGIGGLGVAAAVALPAYQDYTLRAKVAASMAYANNLSIIFSSQYEQDGVIPSDNSLASAALKPDYVRNFEILDNGTIQVFLNFSTLNGNSFALVPSLDTANKIQWECRTVTIPTKFMPLNCRTDLEK